MLADVNYNHGFKIIIFPLIADITWFPKTTSFFVVILYYTII